MILSVLFSVFFSKNMEQSYVLKNKNFLRSDVNLFSTVSS